MPVEPEPRHYDAVEAAHEEVGQVVGAGLVALERAGEELVAVGAGQAPEALEAAAAAAVGVGEHDLLAGGRLAGGRGDALRAVVELWWQRPHVDLQAPPACDRLHVQRQRSAGDDDASHAGKASWSMKRSLKSARPESSM